MQAQSLRGEKQKEVKYKVEGDPRSALTEADVRAQSVVVGSLLKTFGPALTIVGEEDDNESARAADPSTLLPLNSGIVSLKSNEDSDSVPISDVCVIVDPVDGTREFCEGRLHHVQCLIGIAVNGKAVAGVIGLPFPRGADGFSKDFNDPTASSVVYGIVGKESSGTVGCFNDHLRSQRAGRADRSPSDFVVTTGDSSNSVLKAAREAAFACASAQESTPFHIIRGGCGNKMLSVAENVADCALNHFGTCIWDTCAPEAILRASGGKVTDMFGSPLVHSKTARSLVNTLGVVATAGECPVKHEVLCAALRQERRVHELFENAAEFPGNASATSAPQAFDIARALDGAPLTVRYLAESIAGAEHKDALLAYEAPESSAVRGLMSDAVRLQLKWKDAKLPASVFYKRVDLAALAHMKLKQRTAPMKVARDVNSFYVESSFLGSNAARALTDAGVGVPRCYASAAECSERSLIESKFALIMEDLNPPDGWFQTKSLNLEQAKAAVVALAKLHAFFLPDATYLQNGGEAAVVELEKSLWSSGCYWSPSKQPMDDHVAHLEERYAHHVRAFHDYLEEVKKAHPDNSIETVGSRLASVAHQLGAEAFPFGDDNSNVSSRLMRQRTVVHGDPKAANMFLRKNNDSYDVSFIDFQWMGFGLCGTDLGHFLCASVTEEALFDDGASLIDLYYDHFVKFAESFGVQNAETDILTKDELVAQCETGILDTCRCIFAYHWHRSKAGPEMLLRNKDSLGRNSYNKTKFNAMWVMRRSDELLRKRGVTGSS